MTAFFKCPSNVPMVLREFQNKLTNLYKCVNQFYSYMNNIKSICGGFLIGSSPQGTVNLYVNTILKKIEKSPSKQQDSE